MDKSLELLRPADLAAMLGTTTGRVYQLVASGTIPAIRIGRSIWIPRGAWEKWLVGRTEEALASLKVGPPEKHDGERRAVRSRGRRPTLDRAPRKRG